jgi:hypothetical protein
VDVPEESTNQNFETPNASLASFEARCLKLSSNKDYKGDTKEILISLLFRPELKRQ